VQPFLTAAVIKLSSSCRTFTLPSSVTRFFYRFSTGTISLLSSCSGAFSGGSFSIFTWHSLLLVLFF